MRSVWQLFTSFTSSAASSEPTGTIRRVTRAKSAAAASRLAVVEAAHHLRQLLQLAERLALDGPLRREGQPHARAPARGQLGQHHVAARADRHGGAHDHQGVGPRALGHVRGPPRAGSPARARA